MSKNIRDISRGSYTYPDSFLPDIETIQVSSLIRIADATEVIAKNYNELLGENKRLKERFNTQQQLIIQLENSNRSLRGHITRLRKKLETSNPKPETLQP